MNYFAARSIGERYARFRPDFHAEAIREIVRFTGPVGHALDVACGTGQSTRALAAIADAVEGVDQSPEMLGAAAPHARVHYAQASAEHLPFADASLDLVNVALGFHWLDQPIFLREAARVLRRGGWLTVYNHYFSGGMAGRPDFAEWMQDSYAKRFPSAIRQPLTASEQDWQAAGLTPIGSARFFDRTPFGHEGFCGYLLTHSAVAAAIDRGADTIESAGAWLDEALRPFFEKGTQDFIFTLLLDVYRLEEA
jgi:SAM-dependent methyltransferase